MASRLTVVTGPPGVDIGPVAARLGRSIGDGFAVRVVRSNVTRETPHTSPDPFHRVHGTPGHEFGAFGAVRLDVLPSAWQDPQTNLGVVYDTQPDMGLVEDLHTLNALGLDPSHRLTVQSNVGSVIHVRPPVEVGNVGVQARDSVLRAGGRVLIEAGDGQTFMQALATVGIPPWAEWIGHLDRWIVLDVKRMELPLPGAVGLAVEQLDGSSGAYDNGQYLGGATLRVALLNAQLLIPGIAGHDYNVGIDEGDTPRPGDGIALADLLDAVYDRTGMETHLVGTGRIDGTGVWSWIDSGHITD